MMLIILTIFFVFLVFYGASLHAMHQEQQISKEARKVLTKASSFASI